MVVVKEKEILYTVDNATRTIEIPGVDQGVFFQIYLHALTRYTVVLLAIARQEKIEHGHLSVSDSALE